MSDKLPHSLIPDTDVARLRTLHQYQIVNTTPEKIFDDFVALSAQLFNVPISLISLVDEDRVWYKANTGLPGLEGVARPDSLCSAAILQDEPLVYPDLEKERCRLVSPFVAQSAGLRFYAGSALRMPDDSNIGTLCVIGREAREFTETESVLLTRLAYLVSQTIALRGQFLAQGQLAEWDYAHDELEARLNENTTLARYLTSRAMGAANYDTDVLDMVYTRLESIQKVLDKYMVKSQ
ncbi:GAF domain-containing protein [Hymenobacter sp. DG25A]|uniref:GAF domain-containing protein n=1 Tax=Hymenobacter sp. DG25A TaxID=1385663 RepID=UPI0006C8A3FF|nr:GAF domain-containing protein [Hymenobacter sp. DG25A]